MLLKMYSVYDSKAEAYMTPQFYRSRGEAIRSFSEAVNAPVDNSAFAKYPADFTLFEVGEFNDEQGLFFAHKTPISIGLALDFVKPIV